MASPGSSCTWATAAARGCEPLDLRGKIALIDWRVSSVGIGELGLELGNRGAAAVVMTSLEGGARFQGADALGTGVSGWHAARRRLPFCARRMRFR